MAMSIMLSVPEKKPGSGKGDAGVKGHVFKPVSNYIALHYQTKGLSETLETDLNTVRRLRSSAVGNPGSLQDRIDVIRSYIPALAALRSRFPLSPQDVDHPITDLTFSWTDAFKPAKKAAGGVSLEMAAAVFNLGAFYSQVGDAHLTSDGEVRHACNSFQLAAGAFAFLRQHECPKVAAAGPATVDVTAECAGLLEKLMLAQAQECFFEKAIADDKPHPLCAKIAMQVGFYYDEANFILITHEPLNHHFEKHSWVPHLRLKSSLFHAEASYQWSLDLHEKEEIGEEIARLKFAISCLSDIKKIAKHVTLQVQEDVMILETNVKRNLERAQKENASVYLMRVPSDGSLSPIPAASLVKSSPMSDIFDNFKEKLFASIIPDRIAKEVERYTKIVDDLIRVEVDRMRAATEKNKAVLKEMDLPNSILALEGNCVIPGDLKEDVGKVQMDGGSASLDAGIQQLKDLRRVGRELLDQAEELLQKDARDDAQCRSQYGTRWTRPRTSTLTKNLQDKLNMLAGNLKQATESDEKIEIEVKEHSALLSILDHQPIESALPSLSRPVMSMESNEVAVVGALRASSKKLDILCTQRTSLQGRLEAMKLKDDVVSSLMAASTTSSEEFIQQEVAKYTDISMEITKNIEEQEQLLLQIKAQNNDFSSVFDMKVHQAAQEKCLKQIEAAISRFREIKNRIDEGLKYYATLQDSIMSVKVECSDYIMTRSIQCREMIEDVQRQVSCFRPFKDEKSYNALKNYFFGDDYTDYSASHPPSPPS